MTFPNPLDLLRFLFSISILVFVHELGHFLAAKRAGIKVEEFGIGFPPTIFKKKIGETLYALNLFPIGGYVRLYGEEENVKEKKNRAFYNQSTFVRSGVVIAGVVMNFFLAVLLFSVIFWNVGTPKNEGIDRITVSDIVPDSPASQAGIKAYDQLVSIEGIELSSSEDLQKILHQNAGKSIQLEVRRAELFPLSDKAIEKGLAEKVTLNIIPRVNPPEGQGALGIAFQNIKIVETQQLAWYKAPFVSLKEGLGLTMTFTIQMLDGLGQMISTLIVKKEAPKDVAGPIGIFLMTNQVAKLGFLPLIHFLGVLSLNLAVLNIMPFPALDGGRLVFIITEAIFGKKVHAKVEYVINMVGFGLLLLFLLWVTRQDILRFGSSF